MPSNGGRGDRPNVLWIMADQHNAKCTSWGDFPTDVHTPSLDRLAGEGVRFDRAYCQNPICTPSRTSYLTGQYPSNHGFYGLTGDGGTVDAPTLFTALSDRGYRTGAFDKIHTPEGLIEPDLDELYDAGGSNAPDRFEEYLRGKGRLTDRDDRQYHDQPGMQQLDGRPSRLPYEDQVESVSTDRAIEFVDDAVAADDPFCAWVTFHRPHQVYAPAQEFWDRYEGEIELPPSAFEDLDDKPPTQHNRGPDEEAPHALFEPRNQEAFLRRKLQGYLGSVSMIDACVGRLLDALEEAGVREDTIVVYCADHGDFAAEHGFPEKAPGISYDAITRVPFVWSWPGQFREGVAVDDLVETVDLFPTLLSLVDGTAVPSADGQDLSGLLTGEDTEPLREYAITENLWTRTVHTGDQSLTVYPDGYFGAESEEYLEFYDLADDPWETTNLAASDDPPGNAIDRHLRHLRHFFATQRRAVASNAIENPDGDLTDGTIPPGNVAAYLDANDGDQYL
jgi:arylsulfatase A-like enzyme